MHIVKFFDKKYRNCTREGKLTIFYYSKVKSPHPSTVNVMPQTPLMKSFLNPILTNLILNPIYCFNFQSDDLNFFNDS